ncbi:TetR/AcrR family transcriptional regulator [Brevundimonas lenta]|uniref:AcrR family transcriptional regulator n=1 Tax=Brevundimonas lenta TaxID=424796 RepID=A0A7W6JGE6_9CAUL|nr:TetR/AcrR family transcriptional regulator [Brevundimonas lenta]MBB4083607.1 AcrR family transcriptional regulator [Brevundimonas lenta]
MVSEKVRSTYHHGDARNALLKAAGELLEQAGAAGLSLRQVAERAGLSRQAPYNHFADKSALLAELIVHGFDQLRRAMESSERDGTNAQDRLRLAGLAYIRFAQSSPALFRLMFASELVDPASHPQVQAGQGAALAVVTGIVAAMADTADAADLTLAAWALVHGYAVLCNEAGLEAPDRGEERAALFARIIAAAAAS